MPRILDAKYEQKDLNKVMTKQCQHLSTEEQEIILSLLRNFEDLFDGIFGTWNTTTVYLELRDGAKPLCSRPYPVPRVHKAMFKKEHERIVSLWVLEHANDSKWVGPYLTQPKVKKNRVHLLIDFWNLNRQLKRKPYPMTKISDMLLKSEGFKSSTSLDLNIGYYHISLIEEASNLCTIILPWWKYW